MNKILGIIAVILYSVCSFGQDHEAALISKAKKIHESCITIDSHTDTPLRMMQPGFNLNERHDPRTDYTKVDLPRMKEGGLDASFFAVFVSQGPRTSEGNEKVRKRALLLFDTIHASVKRNSPDAVIAVNSNEIVSAEKSGKRAICIGVENGYAIGKDLSLISTYYLRGARYITLCHTKNNDICDSSTDTTEYDGLSVFGREVITEMNHVGLMVDISHISDKAVEDVLAVSLAPVVASHSCAKALCNNPRNLNDTLLKRIAKKGGVIQMCILSDYVKTPPPNPPRDSARAAARRKFNNFDGLTDEQMKEARKEWNAINDKYPPVLADVKDVANHIDHLVRVAGINHVGIGTDFDGGGGVNGCFDVSEMGNITLELVRRGYSERDLKKIWGENFLRVMRKVERVAEKYKRSCQCNG